MNGQIQSLEMAKAWIEGFDSSPEFINNKYTADEVCKLIVGHLDCMISNEIEKMEEGLKKD